MRKWEFDASKQEVSNIVSTVEQVLVEYRVNKQVRIRTILAVEDSLVRLIDNSHGTSKVQLKVSGFLGDIKITLSTEGESFEFVADTPEIVLDDEIAGSDSENFIRNIVLRSYAKDIRYKHKNGKNYVSILTVKSPRRFLWQTLGAFALAIILGIIMRAVSSDAVNAWITDTILKNMQSIFMNGLKMVVAPVVFLSIVGSIAQFSDLSDVGRIGLKVIFLYFLTSVVAVCVGIGLFFIIKPGDSSLASLLSESLNVDIAKVDHVSLIDTMVGVVPNNFLKAFADNNMLQIIFLAVITGVALNAAGEKGNSARQLFESLGEVFMYITLIFVKLVPLAVFCSMLSTILSTGLEAILSVLSIFWTVLLGLFCMMVFYCILLVVLGRVNPLVMLKKYVGTMLQVFSLSSSNASISLNMDACDKKFGVDRKLYSLSIPLGATLNMDGLCVNLSVISLSLANVFGVIPSAQELVQIAITIIIISMGMPGIPGTALIGLTMLLPQLNVPVEAVGLIMGIYALLDMFETVSNCLGDVSATVIVAKREKLLDETIFYKK